jgi:hypothetical protein
MQRGTQAAPRRFNQALLFSVGALRAVSFGQKTLADGENRRHMYSSMRI